MLQFELQNHAANSRAGAIVAISPPRRAAMRVIRNPLAPQNTRGLMMLPQLKIGILSRYGCLYLFPLQFLIAAMDAWLNRQQQRVINYLKEKTAS
jgi:hypothetical protein